MALAFRPFSKSDWWGLAGAEPFADGREPELAELEVDGVSSIAIWDATGLTIMSEEEIEVHIPAELDVDGPSGLEDIEVALEMLRPETSTIALEALGFRHPAGGPVSVSQVVESSETIADARWLDAHGARLERDPEAPELWAVWSMDEDGEILGAGPTAKEALSDARATVRGWRALLASEEVQRLGLALDGIAG